MTWVVGIREANLPYQFVNKLNSHILYKYRLTVLLFIFSINKTWERENRKKIYMWDCLKLLIWWVTALLIWHLNWGLYIVLVSISSPVPFCSFIFSIRPVLNKSCFTSYCLIVFPLSADNIVYSEEKKNIVLPPISIFFFSPTSSVISFSLFFPHHKLKQLKHYHYRANQQMEMLVVFLEKLRTFWENNLLSTKVLEEPANDVSSIIVLVS